MGLFQRHDKEERKGKTKEETRRWYRSRKVSISEVYDDRHDS